jgi:hypothetical protein
MALPSYWLELQGEIASGLTGSGIGHEGFARIFEDI